MTGDPTAIELASDPRLERLTGTTYHGGKFFDVPYMSQIDENLWMGGCTDGLTLPSAIKHLVSLYPWEAYTVRTELLSRLVVRMFDSLDQGLAQVDAIARWVNSCRSAAPTLVHCQAGLNRSGLICARALILDGMEPAHAIDLLRLKRSDAVLCNQAFEDWLYA